MGANLLHEGATVLCAHQGPAMPLVSNPRVRVSGQNTILISTPYVITCPTPANQTQHCFTGSWTTAALRLKSLGQPLVLVNSNSTCATSLTPMHIMLSQQRVKGE